MDRKTFNRLVLFNRVFHTPAETTQNKTEWNLEIEGQLDNLKIELTERGE